MTITQPARKSALLAVCCLSTVLACARAPQNRNIEGAWTPSAETSKLLNLTGDATKGTMTFLPDGTLQVISIPPSFIGSSGPSPITASGRWEAARDGSPSLRTTVTIEGGQVSSVLSILKEGERTLLVNWLDEPGGQQLSLQRVNEASPQKVK